MLSGVVSGRLRGLALDDLARLGTAFALEAVTGRAAAEWLSQVTVQAVP